MAFFLKTGFDKLLQSAAAVRNSGEQALAGLLEKDDAFVLDRVRSFARCLEQAPLPTALVSEEVFNAARDNLGKGTRDFRQYDHVRKSIFPVLPIVRCAAMRCAPAARFTRAKETNTGIFPGINKRKDISRPCTGTRIRYADLVSLVTDDLNSLI